MLKPEHWNTRHQNWNIKPSSIDHINHNHHDLALHIKIQERWLFPQFPNSGKPLPQKKQLYNWHIELNLLKRNMSHNERKHPMEPEYYEPEIYPDLDQDPYIDSNYLDQYVEDMLEDDELDYFFNDNRPVSYGDEDEYGESSPYDY